jgi:hypothetical protein
VRLWSLHPRYLDRAGLTAVWREALLAQAVLAGRTKGYRRHPQLVRFRAHPTPRRAIAAYLQGVWIEANARGFRFDRGKLRRASQVSRIAVSRGQLDFEFEHLCQKLKNRDPARHKKLLGTEQVMPHPLFRAVRGGLADWEKIRSKL